MTFAIALLAGFFGVCLLLALVMNEIGLRQRRRTASRELRGPGPAWRDCKGRDRQRWSS